MVSTQKLKGGGLITFYTMFIAFAPLLYPDLPKRKFLLWFSGIYPYFAYLFINGGYFGLPKLSIVYLVDLCLQ